MTITIMTIILICIIISMGTGLCLSSPAPCASMPCGWRCLSNATGSNSIKY